MKKVQQKKHSKQELVKLRLLILGKEHGLAY